MKKALTDLFVRRLKPAERNLDVVDQDQLDCKGVLRHKPVHKGVDGFTSTPATVRAAAQLSSGRFLRSSDFYVRQLCRNFGHS